MRVGYSKRGPWFDGEVLEARGKVMKVRLDEAGVAYYVRLAKGWVDQQLQAVIVAAPDTTPQENGPKSCCSSCAHGGPCGGAAPSRSKASHPGRSTPRELAVARRARRVIRKASGSSKLSRQQLAEVRRAERLLRKGG